jgi:hypothetical protein
MRRRPEGSSGGNRGGPRAGRPPAVRPLEGTAGVRSRGLGAWVVHEEVQRNSGAAGVAQRDRLLGTPWVRGSGSATRTQGSPGPGEFAPGRSRGKMAVGPWPWLDGREALSSTR